MKLHYLRIEGMGPFAAPMSIDFSRFDASGIFLLEGPTGSGKSSIIDAITFALYGDVARLSDASKDRLRSSYCAPDDPSSVECVFEVTSGIYRVIRTPTYVKPGRKTKVNATVQLERVAEDGEGIFHSIETLSRSHAEADAEITSLVGLKKEQFLQTVVLPQGKFATFLAARSEARREILQDVFGTHIYQVLQERFREAANEHAAAVDAARSAVNEARTQILELIDLHKISTAQEPGMHHDSPANDEALLSRLTELLEEQERYLSTELEQVKERLAQTRTREDHARQAARDLASRNSLVQRLAELEAQEDTIVELRHELSEARRAETARPFIEDFDRSYEVLKEANAGVSMALQALENEATSAFPLPDSLQLLTCMWGRESSSFEGKGEAQSDPIAILRTHVTDIEKLRARLSDLLPLEEGLSERETSLFNLEQRLVDITATRADIEGLIAQLPEQCEHAQASFEEARRIAEGAPALEKNLLELRQRHEHARNAELYEARIPAAEQAVEEAALAAQRADAQARALRTAWMADAASALARELNDNVPCPVCGSLTHPSPASPQGKGDAISHAQVEEADTARQNADRALHEHREALADLKARLQHERLSADGSREVLSAAVEAAQVELQAAQQADASLPTLSTALEELHIAQSHAHTQSVALREEAAALNQQRELLAATIDADRRRCHEAASPFLSLRSHEAACAARIVSLEDALAALTTWARGLEAFEASATRLNQVLSLAIPTSDYIARLQETGTSACQTPAQERHSQESPLSGVQAQDCGTQEFQAAQDAIARHREHLRSAEECSVLEARIEDYLAAVVSTREGLANPVFASLTGDEEGALAACREHLQAVEEAHSLAIARQERAAAQSNALERAIEKFRRANTTLEAAVEAAEPARRLHALASATTPENLTRTPLAAWVLMARFEEVLAAANPRLLAISQGRYELIRVDDDGSQSRKSGLGVAVIDHDTETPRLPSTLSGGETFYVSLSLALGLADVVTGENGGVELRTMFIDEGFGSLDATTLETVMVQLQRLRDSGRTVGVISHVHEMSTLIPDQIQVRWNPKEGSQVTIRA